MEAPAGISVASVKSELVKQYSQLTHLHTYAIAVNESYASDTTIINENDVIAIIPPVSGG
jgi:molybdopterin converting factor small subunit